MWKDLDRYLRITHTKYYIIVSDRNPQMRLLSSQTVIRKSNGAERHLIEPSCLGITIHICLGWIQECSYDGFRRYNNALYSLKIQLIQYAEEWHKYGGRNGIPNNDHELYCIKAYQGAVKLIALIDLLILLRTHLY